jgi:ATP-dependent RNA helicase DDX56/DBP9
MSYLLDEEKVWTQRDFGLDSRLIKALSKLGFIYPTLVQSKCIPIALEGKDALVRARTGSGKTLAFGLPVLHKILVQKSNGKLDKSYVRALVLAPTKELCKQIEKNINDILYYCKDTISICSLADDSTSAQQYRLKNKPDIVVSTPAKIVSNIRSNNIDLSNVQTLVIDEADLVLSFGYAEDVQFITSKMPKIFQVFF